MALSGAEQQDILLRAKTLILEDFHDDFQNIYSYAVAVLEVAPEQANNEIRNALNHISRALCADCQDVATENLGQAKGHIERAKRDCLKLANIHLHEQIKSDLLHVEMVEGAVPLSIKQRLATLEHRGAEARRAEALGQPGVIDDLASLFADQKQFRDEVHTQYMTATKPFGWAQRLLMKARRQTGTFFLGLASGILTSIIVHMILVFMGWGV